MLKGWSNILTVVCITIAGVVEAGQQALKDAPKVAALAPGFIRGNSWNYVPLLFLIAAGAIWVIGRLIPSNPAQGAEIVLPKEAPGAELLRSKNDDLSRENKSLSDRVIELEDRLNRSLALSGQFKLEADELYADTVLWWLRDHIHSTGKVSVSPLAKALELSEDAIKRGLGLLKSKYELVSQPLSDLDMWTFSASASPLVPKYKIVPVCVETESPQTDEPTPESLAFAEECSMVKALNSMTGDQIGKRIKEDPSFTRRIDAITKNKHPDLPYFPSEPKRYISTLQKRALDFSVGLFEFLREVGPRPVKSVEIGPWLDRVIGGYSARFADEARQLRHELRERNLRDLSLDQKVAIGAALDEAVISSISERIASLAVRLPQVRASGPS